MMENYKDNETVTISLGRYEFLKKMEQARTKDEARATAIKRDALQKIISFGYLVTENEYDVTITKIDDAPH